MNNKITGRTFNELYFKVCKKLIEDSDFDVKNRKGRKTKELINTCLVLKNPTKRIITLNQRKLSLYYLAGELIWYISGSNKLSFISNYSKFWNTLDDGNGKANSCYGKKLLYDINRNGLTQFDHALRQLISNLSSKKAVMTIFDKHSADLRTKDLPCTMYLQFFIRENKLYLITHMRSNDVWFGLSYDLPFFTLIQEMMYLTLKKFGKENKMPELENIVLGDYIHMAGSLHLYGEHFTAARNIVSYGQLDIVGFEPMPTITENTLTQMQNLEVIEKMIRAKEHKKYSEIYLSVFNRITDKFLLRIIKWLTKEEVLQCSI